MVRPARAKFGQRETAVKTDFMVRLFDVYPNGSAINIAEGCLRAKFRQSCLTPNLVNSGEVTEYVIYMASTSNLFKKGHCIRYKVDCRIVAHYLSFITLSFFKCNMYPTKKIELSIFRSALKINH